ncbi:hypothetical protein RhiirA1_541044 [Rhizophagus irregularis]|uniref:F-box domain-containing protein n=1 Tax=Rhizophagus irregularis TaxID=588596 RepID=A0A2N0R5A4_9GLOM|nr:hypothetical protein RhiirA1_541044 [Rhizophagus irregularis]
MACSKVFLGNFPELTYDIIQYFQDDIPTLRSCILVNKFLCQITIPLLWKDPFSMKNPKNYKNFHFIEIYLQKINESDKTLLNKCGIKLPTKTFFNYSNFIKCINTRNICSIIMNWFEINRTNKNFTFSNGRIFFLLIKIFIENEAKLNTFEIEISYKYLTMGKKYFNSTFNLILDNPKFINNLKNLKLHFNEAIKKYDFNYEFLKCFYYHCNSISSFHIRFSEYKSFKDNHFIIENQLSQIINSQKNLKIIFSHIRYINEYMLPFSSESIPLYNIIGGNTDSSKSLKNIIFHRIDFRTIIYIKKAFEQLNVLESIHVIDCLIFNSNFIQQIIDLNKPFKLISLFIRKDEHEFFMSDENRNLQIELLMKLFQKVGEYLENIGFDLYVNDELKYKSLEFINNYCKRIKFFGIHTSSIQKAHIVLDSVKIFEQTLNYLSISTFTSYDEKDESRIELLLRLAHVLPCKLEYLNLYFNTQIRKNIWEVFLKSLNHVFIKKLLFKINNLFDDFLPYIKEYIMKEKRVEYLAIEGYIEIQASTYRDKKELFFMTDELKEFESYNIKVKEYNNLYVRAYEFIDEMY